MLFPRRRSAKLAPFQLKIIDGAALYLFYNMPTAEYNEPDGRELRV